MNVTEQYFGKEWTEALGEKFIYDQVIRFGKFIQVERESKNVTPLQGEKNYFRTFRETPYNDVKMIIPSLEPYHDSNYSGLSYGTNESPSTQNLNQELHRTHGGNTKLQDLTSQGVLLLPIAHSAIIGEPKSHFTIWEDFTKEIVHTLNKRDDLVWLLLGSDVKIIRQWILNKSHGILEYGHPSPLNTENPITGSGCFTKCDEELLIRNEKINWNGN